MLKVGIIGAGGIAMQHATCYLNIPEAQIVAVADIVPERADRIAAMFGAKAFYDVNQVLELADVDVVDICLPTYLHCEYTIKAAKANKHILCEKPIALNVEEGLRMIRETEKAGVKFMVAQVLRYFPEYVSAKNNIENGVIGKPVMVRTYRGGVHPARVREWYGIVEQSGGAVQDTLIHDIDFLKSCFGAVKDVFAKGNLYKRTKYLEYDLVTMEFENGVLAHLIVDWARPENGHFSTRLEIVGTEGIMEYNMDDSMPLHLLAAADGEQKDGVAIPESPLAPRTNPYAIEIIEFLKCVQQDTNPPIPVAEALDSLRIVTAIQESMRDNKPMKIQEGC